MNVLTIYHRSMVIGRIISLMLVSIVPLLGDDTQRIVADGSTVNLGCPTAASPQSVIAGKPLMVVWPNASKQLDEPVVQVHRLTHTQKVRVAEGKASTHQGGWSWQWTPPKTKSVVRYQVSMANAPESPVILEVLAAEWMDGMREQASKVKWESDGLTDEEIAALKELGIHGKDRSASRSSELASLQLSQTNQGASRRRVHWDAEQHQLVVWQPGPATGDLMVRAPRWWISKAALSNDHGRIRLYQLLFDPPLHP